MPPPSHNRPLWTRLLPALSDGQAHAHHVIASVLPLLAPSIATMGMGGAVSSSSDLTALNNNHTTSATSSNSSSSSSSSSSSTPSCQQQHSYHHTRGQFLVYGSTLKSCAICLEDYQPGDRLKLLEPCGHCFHLECVNIWFDATFTSASFNNNHNSPNLPCPVCKAVVVVHSLPSPQAKSVYNRSSSDHSNSNSNSNSSSISSNSSNNNDDNEHENHSMSANHQQIVTATGTTSSRENVNSNNDDSNSQNNTRQPWAHVQLIDLSVHQSWVEWFSELWKVVELGNTSSTRRRLY